MRYKPKHKMTVLQKNKLETEQRQKARIFVYSSINILLAYFEKSYDGLYTINTEELEHIGDEFGLSIIPLNDFCESFQLLEMVQAHEGLTTNLNRIEPDTNQHLLTLNYVFQFMDKNDRFSRLLAGYYLKKRFPNRKVVYWKSVEEPLNWHGIFVELCPEDYEELL